MTSGPLIPGMNEFDGPRRRVPRIVWWIAAACGVVVLLIGVAGFGGGVGPLRTLGLVTGARVELEAQAQSSRTSNCPVTGIVGDRVWASVALEAPLGERQVIRAMDREPLPREDA